MILSNIILFLSIINFLVTLFVFFNAKKEKAKPSFIIFSLISSIWLFNNFLLISNHHNVYPLSYGLGILVLTSAFIWVCHFLEEKLSKFTKFFILPFSAVLFLIATFTDLIVYPLTGVTSLGYVGMAGNLFLIYSIYFLFLIIISLYKLLNNFLLEKNTLKKKQIFLIFIGGSISGILSFIINFFIPIFFNTFGFIKLVNLVFFPLPIFIIYTTVKHQMFGIKIMLTQFLVSVFLSLLLFRFIFSVSTEEYFFNGTIIIISAFLGFIILNSMNKEIELNKKLLQEAQKNLEFEQRLKDTYAQIAEREIKSKYFKK